MLKKKLFLSLLIPFSLSGFSSCKVESESTEKYITDLENVGRGTYFDILYETPGSLNNTYAISTLTGHKLTCFDEEYKISKALYRDLNKDSIIQVNLGNFKKSERCLSIAFTDDMDWFSEYGRVDFYDNGYFHCLRTSYLEKYTDGYFKCDDTNGVKNLFNVAEQCFIDVENKKVSGYEVAKSRIDYDACLQEFRSHMYDAGGDFKNELRVHVHFIWEDNNSFIISNGNTPRLSMEVDNRLFALEHSFIGYEEYDYDISYDAILNVSANWFNPDLKLMLYGGTNFTKIGIMCVYPDYVNGKVKGLVANYKISSIDGEDLYNCVYQDIAFWIECH